MARHPDTPVFSASPLAVGVITFTTNSTSNPTVYSDLGGGVLASVARSAQGRFVLTLNGPYKEVRAHANVVKRDTNRAQCGTRSTGTSIEVSVLDTLGAEVDTTGLEVDVFYALQR